MKNFRRVVLSLVVGALALSCNAPHLNPLDPSNPDSKLGQLSGIVQNSSNQPIPNVRITWKNQNTIATSDSLGRYTFKNLEIKSGWLFFEGSDYLRDSLYVQWNGQKNITVDDKKLFLSTGILDGYVYTSETPGKPISNVSVLWKNQNILALTNSSGYFKFAGLTTNAGDVYFEKDGFVSDTVNVQWNKQTSVRLDNQFLNFSKGSIVGSVRSRSGKIISSANVTLKSSGVTVNTDAGGYYHIDNISHNPDSLLFQAGGYSNLMLAVSWPGSSENATVNASLNANPQLNDLNIYSSIENDYNGAKTFLYVRAKVSDEDVGDIDSVFVNCPDLGISKQPLSYNFSSSSFETIFDATTLPSIEDAIGKIFNIVVRDREGRFFDVGSSFLKRIIRSIITTSEPLNGQPDQPNPVLKWKRFKPGFNFTYMVQVYTNSTVPQLVWEKSNISQDDVAVTVDKNLTSGQNYFWVIWCIDEYLNRSRSYPATFVVQ